MKPSQRGRGQLHITLSCCLWNSQNQPCHQRVPQQTPAPTSQHLPGSELNSLQSLQERCECCAWALIHRTPWDPSTAPWMQLSLEPFRKDLWGSSAALGRRCPTSGWSGEISGRGHTSSGTGLPGTAPALRHFLFPTSHWCYTEGPNSKWLMAFLFFFYKLILIVLNVGRSDFLSREKNCIIFLHLTLLNGKEKSAVFKKTGKSRTLASHSSSFLIDLSCQGTHTTLKVDE